MCRHHFMKTTIKVVTPLLLCLAQGAAAQSVLFNDLAVPPAFPQSEGKQLGPLMLAGEVAAGMMSSNNVYRDASHLGSEASQLALSSTLTSSSDRHLLVGTLEYYAQDFRDSAYQDLDIDATTTTVFGRFVTSELTNLRLLFINEESILGKDQSDQLNSFTSGLETNTRYEAIYEIDNSRYFANVMGRYDQSDSESFSQTATDVLSEALDRSERDYIVLAGRSFAWGRAFLFGGTQAVRYESSSTPSLAERNSDENRYGIGVEYQVGKFSGDLDVYRFTQRFVSDAIPNIENAWVGSGKVNYAATDNFSLLFAVEKRFHETNIPNSGGIFSQDIFLGGTYALAPTLYLRMGPSHNTVKIQNTPVEIARYELDVELGWKLSSHFKLLFTANVFAQEPNNPVFSSFKAQQSNAALSISYSL